MMGLDMGQINFLMRLEVADGIVAKRVRNKKWGGIFSTST
jgi:hypothetical protein